MKHNMKTRSIAIVLLMLVSHAFARIGETEQQIQARYGEINFSGGDHFFYQSAGMVIGVMFVDGVSQSELFKKRDDSELSKDEIAVLLEANAAGSRWIEDPNARLAGVLHGWKLQSGGRHAAYSHGALLIQTDIADKVSAENEAEVAKEKLKGF